MSNKDQNGGQGLGAFQEVQRTEMANSPLPVDLPHVEVGSSAGLMESRSPAPGRPGQGDRGDKRGRETSRSSPNFNTSKSARREDVSEATDVKEKENEAGQNFRKKVEDSVLVTEATTSPCKEGKGLVRKLDLGIITSVTGTPSRSKNEENFTVHSPIFASRRNNNI